MTCPNCRKMRGKIEALKQRVAADDKYIDTLETKGDELRGLVYAKLIKEKYPENVFEKLRSEIYISLGRLSLVDEFGDYVEIAKDRFQMLLDIIEQRGGQKK